MSYRGNPIPQPLRDVALRANADWWRINREHEKEWEEKKSRGEIPEGHGWAGVGSLPEFIAQALWSALLEGAAELSDDAIWGAVKAGYPDAPYPAPDYFVRGARWQHSQLAPVIAAKDAWREGELRYRKETEEENARLRSEVESLKRASEIASDTTKQFVAQYDNLSKALARAKQFIRADMDELPEEAVAEIEKLERGE